MSNTLTQEQKEMAYKVAAAISEWPERFNMNTFSSGGNECGTTFCIAGWACSLAGHYEQTREGYWEFTDGRGNYCDPCRTGKELLGLKSDSLFFNFNLDEIHAEKALQILADEGEEAMYAFIADAV